MFRSFLVGAAVLLLGSCGFGPDVLKISGQTMGTTYNISVVDGDLSERELTEAVEAVLAEVNAQMSNWDPNSEISRFNASPETTPQDISPQLMHVMQAAARIHDQSEGKFDVTLGPLIELWGFGTRRPGDALPGAEAILEAMAQIGQARQITLDPEAGTMTKAAPDVSVMLAAIAKGYGIDALAEALRAREIENFMVEIGGDLITSGTNEKGEPWQIAIEKPEPGDKSIELIVPVSDLGMATSGDYRNFIEVDGARYSHILDPVTGRPITHRTSSVTVLAESAMMADGWATAMLALGAERGLQIANARGLAVYFISRSGEEYITNSSEAFDALQERP